MHFAASATLGSDRTSDAAQHLKMQHPPYPLGRPLPDIDRPWPCRDRNPHSRHSRRERNLMGAELSVCELLPTFAARTPFSDFAPNRARLKSVSNFSSRSIRTSLRALRSSEAMIIAFRASMSLGNWFGAVMVQTYQNRAITARPKHPPESLCRSRRRHFQRRHTSPVQTGKQRLKLRRVEAQNTVLDGGPFERDCCVNYRCRDWRFWRRLLMPLGTIAR